MSDDKKKRAKQERQREREINYQKKVDTINALFDIASQEQRKREATRYPR